MSLFRFLQVIVFAGKALAIDSKNVDALAAKGRSLATLGNYTQAIPNLDKGFAEIPKMLTYWIPKLILLSI